MGSDGSNSVQIAEEEMMATAHSPKSTWEVRGRLIEHLLLILRQAVAELTGLDSETMRGEMQYLLDLLRGGHRLSVRQLCKRRLHN